MTKIENILFHGLDYEVRQLLTNRVQTMMRHIKYLKEQRKKNYIVISRKGWTDDHLQVVCVLNSFYQIVIAPLASSSRPKPPLGLGTDMPIQYGDVLRFDAKRASGLRHAYNDFVQFAMTAGIDERMLAANQADDLVYFLAQRDR